MSEPHTLVHRIEHWAKVQPSRPALHGRRGGSWKSVRWAEYWSNVRAIAKALITLGHQPGDCVAIVGANEPEWVQFQFGIQAARGIPAPIYVTNTAEQARYIAEHSRAKIVICDSQEQIAKFQAGGRDYQYLTFSDIGVDGALAFEDVIALGEKQDDAELDARLDALQEDETCMLIYTSGTTGVPKGVMLDHAGQLLIGRAVGVHAPQLLAPGKYRVVSYLPLCHQAEQVLTNVCQLMTGGETFFCPVIGDIKEYLVHARPTVFLGVPRVWEKFEAALRGRLAESTGIKAKLADWAMETERACFREQVRLGRREWMPLQRKVARKLVADKIKTALGLDQLEVAITGSAPIGVATQDFFAGIGICIYEAYGLSETSGVATITDPVQPGFGTVGRPLDGVTLRISDDGEIQTKGRNNTKGYLHMPELSAELYTEDGWLKTGDLGELTAAGDLKITGRIKELLITAGGKNVAPVELENYIKRDPGIGQAVVVGDRKKYLTALITLDVETLDDLCDRVGISRGALADVAKNEKLERFVREHIERECNKKVASYQTIKYFTILPHEMTVEGGELTATMKLRRSEITKKYADVIEAMYVGKDQGARAAN